MHPHGDDDEIDYDDDDDGGDDGGDGVVGDAEGADDDDADEVVQNTALSDQSSPQIAKEIFTRIFLRQIFKFKLRLYTRDLVQE